MVIKLTELHATHDEYPVQITSFGKLSICIHRKSIDIHRWKSPRVYQLLLLIVAAGGKNIPTHYICDSMWPSQEADKAMQNLEFILRRLRQTLQKSLPKQLKANQVILLQHGKINLNPIYCHIDTWHLDGYIKQAKSLHVRNRHAQAHSIEQQALQMIQGRFLSGESENIVSGYRHAWHTRICNWINETASLWQKQHMNHHKIISLLDTGLEIDPYSEQLLCQRMHILHQEGYSNDAIRYYQDWASLLLQTFGLKPSPIAQEAYQNILNQ